MGRMSVIDLPGYDLLGCLMTELRFKSDVTNMIYLIKVEKKLFAYFVNEYCMNGRY